MQSPDRIQTRSENLVLGRLFILLISDPVLALVLSGGIIKQNALHVDAKTLLGRIQQI